MIMDKGSRVGQRSHDARKSPPCNKRRESSKTKSMERKVVIKTIHCTCPLSISTLGKIGRFKIGMSLSYATSDNILNFETQNAQIWSPAPVFQTRSKPITPNFYKMRYDFS